MQVDAAWCGQFAKSERLWAMSTHPVRSVIFVYLNSCKRFTLNLPPETLEATCSVLFRQFLVQKAQVGVGRKPNHLPFAFSASPGSGKRRSEPKPPKPSRLNPLNIPGMSVAYHVPAMNHLRFTPRAGSLCQLATFQNAAVSGCCDDEQFLKLSRWPVDFAVAGPPRTLASSHPTLQNKSATQNLQDCPFECFGASRIVSLWFFNSAGQSSCSFWRVYDSPLAQAARRFAWIVATWEDRLNSIDWFNIAFDCGCTSGSNADMFKRFFQWSGAKRARKRQLQLEFVLTCLEWIVLLHFVLPGFDPTCGAAAWLTPKALYCFVEEEMWYNRVCIQLRILTICTSSSERNL